LSDPGAFGDGAGGPRPGASPPRPVVWLGAAVRLWAIFGGLLATALAIMSAGSAVSNLLFQRPFPADYELVKHVVAVVIFSFLPYCQFVGANVTVDIFTEGMSAGRKAAMAFLSSLFAVAFSALLLRQMWLGWFSYMQFPETTPVLKLPLWTAFPPILFSLVLLLAAAFVTAVDGWRVARGRPAWLAPGSPLLAEPS
jgi:TRAP-type C4-dicarboxylate transport system permease small subunit